MKAVRLIIDQHCSGSWNMAVDQAILENANESGTTTLRFYLWKPATVSLGYFQPLGQRDQHSPSIQCPLVRRSTGGGAIVHDQELTYSLCVPSRSRWASENQALYSEVHSALIECLRGFGVSSALVEKQVVQKPEPFLCFQRRAAGDVVCQDFKICGSAQRRIDKSILQHGSILLGQSEAAPELPGIKDLAKVSFSVEEFRESLIAQIGKNLGFEFESGELSSSEIENSTTIERNRFQSSAWTAKR